MRAYLWLLMLVGSWPTLVALERPPWFPVEGPSSNPPPHVISLGGLSNDDVEKLKTVPGVDAVEVINDRVRFTWQPWRDGESWTNGKKWIKGSEGIYDFIALKGRIGHTKWTHGGLGNMPPTIIPWSIAAEEFDVHFDDDESGSSCTMLVMGYPHAQPSQLKHEMIRGIAGRKYEVIKCGDGNVILSKSQYGPQVIWQISDHWFARFAESFDKDMIAAYVHRLGSITPADFKIDFNEWVDEEIRGRFDLVDFSFSKATADTDPIKRVLGDKAVDLYLFKDLPTRFGRLQRDAPLIEKWTWFHHARRFLWANRENFRLDSEEWHFELKGPDRYDVEHPPELPQSLMDPPKPEEATPDSGQPSHP